MLLVVFLLVCKHPDKLTPNIIIPFKDSISEKSKNLKNHTLVLPLWVAFGE